MPRLTRPAARARRGLTLLELLVAMIVLGIVGGIVTNVLMRQQHFYRDATQTVNVRRELRNGASLLPAELRAISSVGGDLLEAQATRFAVRAAIGSSVVCGRPAAAVIELPPRELARHTLTSWFLPPQPNDTIFVFNEGANTGAEDDGWEKRTVTRVDATTSGCSASPFLHPTADAGKPRYRLTLDADLPPEVTLGAVVRITRPTRYSLYRRGGGTVWYLGFEEHDGRSWSPIEPIAGPFLAAEGARFAYYDTLGVALSASDRHRTARVEVSLRATTGPLAAAERGGAPLRDSLQFRIGIRNFR